MPVLTIKPHILSYLSASEGYEDENGDYHAGQSEWIKYVHCDAVPNGKEESIAFDDGTIGRYTYTIYLDSSVREFKKGEKVKIAFWNSSKENIFEVLGFHRYQHQAKLWV